MKEHHTDSEDEHQFTKAIGSLRKGEEEAKEIKQKATEKADLRLKAARENAEEVMKRASEEAVALKDKMLLEAKKDIESERAKILSKAEKEAEGLGKKKLKPEDARKLAASIFE
jgi:V/A-type H+/Na+-transporting ATPase subunit G/H